jgi:hypothetical protein
MSTTNLAFQLLAASNYIDALGGVSQSYRQALASYEAEPAAQVVVERERVWLKRGVQSFALAYEAETDAEREWYAGQLRAALSGFVKTEAEAKPAPAMLLGEDPRIEPVRNVLERICGTRQSATNFARRILGALDAAPAAPAPEPLSFTHIDGLAAVDFPSKQWNAAQRFARAIERAHGIGIVASKGEQA